MAINMPRLAAKPEDVIYRDGRNDFTADQSFDGHKLTDLGTPSADDDAATKGYVDEAIDDLAASLTADVVGPATSTDNAIACYDGTTGKRLQSRAVTIDDNDKMTTKATTQALTVLTDGATITLSGNVGNQFMVTIAGDRTVVFSNFAVGQKFLLIVTQDATGGRGLTWPSEIEWTEGTPPELTVTGGRRDVLGFLTIGTDQFIGLMIGEAIASTTTMPPDAVFYATFTAADATALGSYTPEGGTLTTGGSGSWEIQSNALRATTNNHNYAYTQSVAADALLTASLKTGTYGTGVNLYVGLRCSNDEQNGIVMAIEQGANRVVIYELVSGSATVLGTWTMSPAWATNTVYAVQLEVDGTSVIGRVNGTDRITATCSYTTAGRGRLQIYRDGSVSTHASIDTVSIVEL